MRPAQARFHLAALGRRNELLCRIDMWGFVSIMLVLLFLFSAGTTNAHHWSPVDRANAVHSTPQPGVPSEDAMQIYLTRDGRVFFRSLQVVPEDLPNFIREGVRNGAEEKIYLSVDARARYGDAAAVLDRIREAGIQNVSLLTEEPYR
jgi:biopolymer transport protein ExbD/biopolymer transport protein TolR